MSHTATQPHAHTHTHTHTHTPEEHSTCLRETTRIFRVSYPFFLLSYEAIVNSSCKFPHEAITILLS